MYILLITPIGHIPFACMAAGFDYNTCSVLVAIEEQTPDIAQAVHLNKSDKEVGAGDQVCVTAVLLFTYTVCNIFTLHIAVL